MVAGGVVGEVVPTRHPRPSAGVVEVVARADFFPSSCASGLFPCTSLETSGVSRFSVVDVHQDVCLTSELCPALQLEEHRHALVHGEFVTSAPLDLPLVDYCPDIVFE